MSEWPKWQKGRPGRRRREEGRRKGEKKKKEEKKKQRSLSKRENLVCMNAKVRGKFEVAF